jgi:uncharacterized membrane-anchored protein
MHTLRLVFVSLTLAVAALAADQPATTEAPPKTRAEAFERAGVKLVAGPKTVALGKVAELKLPDGFHFVGPESLDRFYELTQNVRGGQEVGVLLAPQDWMLFFDFADIGYVKDDEKDKLNAEKLMSSMTENQDNANSARKERGWDEMKLKGWATPPHYDTKTNHLKWAINLSSSQDNFKEVWINESIRLLGRGGVMNVTLVSDATTFKSAEAEAEQLLAGNFNYVLGEKYAEFKSGDKVAAYGLTALVLGGGAAVAAKAGFFAKLGIYLAKFWKLVAGGAVAVWVGIKKLLNKISGSRPNDPAS